MTVLNLFVSSIIVLSLVGLFFGVVLILISLIPMTITAAFDAVDDIKYLLKRRNK